MANDVMRPDPVDAPALPTYGIPAASLLGLGTPAAPVPRSGATSFSAQGAAKPVATGVNANPAPVLTRPSPAVAAPTGPQAGIAQRIGANTRQAISTTVDGASRLNPLAIGARGFAGALPAASKALGDAAYGFTHPGAGARPDFDSVQGGSWTAQSALTRPTPGRDSPAAIEGGGSAPVSGIAASPGRRVQVNAGPTPQAYTTSDGRSGLLPPGVAVVRQKDGTNTFAATGASVAQATGQPAVAAPVGRPAVSSIAVPTIAPVHAPGFNGASESHEQREARQAALSDLDSLQFQLRGKTTRSARDAMTDIARTRAGLVNSGAQIGAELSAGNRDATSRNVIAALEAQSANDRTVAGELGESARAAAHEDAETSRTQSVLQRPNLMTDAEGNYLAVHADGSAFPVTKDGSQVRLKRPVSPGDITPEAMLDAVVNQLATEQQALQPDPQRIQTLQQQANTLLSKAYARNYGSAGGGS